MFLIFQSFHSGKSAKNISQTISNGEINQLLIRPINFVWVKIIESLAPIISRVMFAFILLFLGIIFFPSVFMPYSWGAFALFFLFTIVSVILWNLFNVLIGLTSFGILEVESLSTVWDLILNSFKGAWILFYLFPDWIKNILNLTPIPYIAAWPIEFIKMGLM